MLKLQKISPAHEELFIQDYERLLSWALQLTHSDRSQAEDLLHDAFIQFTISQPNLRQISNLDGYLYGTLRNLHLSQVRKATRSRLQQLSIVEYESAETGLRSIDPRDLIQVQDQLRQVCHYVCARKETARTASVLVLRFFHGYYPSEIAQVLQTTYKAVKVRLRMARLEAKAQLENPQSLSVINQRPAVEVLPTGFARTAKDFLSELRETVSHSRRGECKTSRQLHHLYRSSKKPIETEQLAHIVSCEACLEEVNRLLGLPSLADRYPVDSIERDKGPRGGPSGGASGGGGRTGAAMKSWRRQAREVFEHDPQELCVSVNGYMQGSQKINSELSELTLDIDLNEQIDFIEIFSEQQIRLLLMNVNESPPEGPGEQSFRVALSQGRTLELNLKFSSPWPTLHVAYHDPTFVPSEVGVESLESDQESGVRYPSTGIQRTSAVRQSESSSDASSQRSVWTRIGDWIGPRLKTRGRGFFLRPATVTAVLALMLIGVLLIVQVHRAPTRPLTAATLLHQSAAAEEALAARTDQVLHRTINLEERVTEPRAVATGLTSGDPISRRRIEIWQSAQKGITARRLYDEKNNLIAGDWRRADGVQTLYHHGSQPKLQIRNAGPPDGQPGWGASSQSAIRNFEDAWQLSPSANEFSLLIGSSGQVRVEERADVYVISADVSTASGSDRVSNASAPPVSTASGPGSPSGQPAWGGGSDRVGSTSAPSAGSSPPSAVNSVLLKATLVLNRTDLHPIEQTLVIRQGNETREYKFTESLFEEKRPGTVAPSVFEPEPELLSTSEPGTRNSKPETSSPLALTPLPAPVATAAVEVEVLRALNQIGADLGEQISVVRTPEGLLRVEGIVDTEKRKQEILSALAGVAGNSAVRLEIQTAAEAVKKPSRSRSSPAAVSIQVVEPAENKIPAYLELRRFLQRTTPEDQLDGEVLRFADRALAHSRQLLLHGGALQRLAKRFSSAQINALDADARSKLLSMMGEHAGVIRRESASLRQELAPIFSGGESGAGGSEIGVNDDADLALAAERLFSLCALIDGSTRSAFSLSASASTASAIKARQFWISLRETESLSRKIEARPSR